MRIIRRLATGLALISVVPATAAAQDSRPFADSWFWGLKGGVTAARTSLESAAAPTVGLDWLITRSRAGLYLSLEQAFFDDLRGRVVDEQGARSDVSMSNYRRASAALVAFPGNFDRVRPYAGIGVALNMVEKASPVDGDFASAPTLRAIEELRTRTSFMFMGGVQGELDRVSLFAQAAAMPTGRDFLLYGGSLTYAVEAGVRINVGSAIERIDR
ncbi:MAG TPA: hypothetical protein VGE02_11175 [Gemmatimonadales bacterium]